QRLRRSFLLFLTFIGQQYLKIDKEETKKNLTTKIFGKLLSGSLLPYRRQTFSYDPKNSPIRQF
ncbi:hypothetical protein, partial [Alloprevotella tannerae]